MKVPGFSLSMTENRDGLSLEGWLQFTACQSDTVEPTMVDGRQALTCTSQPAQIAEHAAWFEYNGTMLYVTSGSMTRDDFEFLIGSIRL